jgi:hypothetical protein
MPGATSNDFKLLNSNADFVHMVDIALQYASQQDPRFGVITQMVADQHTSIMFNPLGNPVVALQDQGQSLYSASSNMVLWNPYSALLVYQTDPVTGGKTYIGIQSSTMGLLHEMTHSLDPKETENFHDPMAQYGNQAEYVAVSIESVFAEWLNEPGRNNHNGVEIPVMNPTLHTITTEDGAWQLTWMGEDGKPVYGPQISLTPAVVQHLQEFGSGAAGTSMGENDNDPQYDEHANDPPPVTYTGNEHDNDPPAGSYPGSNPGNENDNDPQYDEHANDPPPGTSSGGGGGGGSEPYEGGGYGGGEGGCVAIESYLPDGRTAGAVKVGDTMQLGDEVTMGTATGVVGYSMLKAARGYRITTESGASLVCSDTAPIPTRDKGLLTPAKLLGEHVAVRWDESGMTSAGWETVSKVEEVGTIQVQHITVGDKCFWSGEKKGAYILHHNMKQAGGEGGGGYDWPWAWDDPLTSNPNQATHQGNDAGDAALIVGVPNVPATDALGFF